MAWGPSAWLAVARIAQFLCAVAGASLNGFVTALIYSKDLDIPLTMLALQLLVAVILIYTVIAMALQHTGKRIERRGWLLTFIITDILFLSADLAIVCILSRSGLPKHCQRLITFRPGTDQAPEGFTTLGFSDESTDLLGVRQIGEFDQYCNHERANFIVSLFLVFAFQATVVFASLTYYKTKHTFNSKLHDCCSDDERSLQTLSPKPSSPSPPARSSSASGNPAASNHRMSFATTIAPASEGVMTRNTSIRSTVTTSTVASAGNNPRASLMAARRGQGHTIPRRPIGPSPPPPLPPARSPGGGGGHAFLPISLNEEDSDDDNGRGMQVADGMHYRLAHPVTPADRPQHRRPPPPPPVGRRTSGPGPQRAPPLPNNRPPTPPASTPDPSGTTPLLLENQEVGGDDAHHALVSDGMRPAGPGLPPYEPPPTAAPASTSATAGFHTIPLDESEATASKPPRQQPPPPPAHRRSHSRSKGSTSSGMGGMPRLLEEEEVAGDDAHHALVSDGMRPAGPGLPPYEPGPGEGYEVKGR